MSVAYVLVVTCDEDYDPPDVHGPFRDIAEGQRYAERYRDRQGLPIEATPENNDEWTERGWYFGIVRLRQEV